MNAPVYVFVNGSYPQGGLPGPDMQPDMRPDHQAGQGLRARPDVPPAVSPNRPMPDLMADHAARTHQGVAAASDPARFEPDRAQRDFPSLWRAYVRAHFRDYAHVCQVFGVCERTARKWFEGETGCNGRHVAVAYAEHPDAVSDLLRWAAE